MNIYEEIRKNSGLEESITDLIKKENAVPFKSLVAEWGYYKYSFTVNESKFEAEINGVDVDNDAHIIPYHVFRFEDTAEGDGMTGKGNVEKVFSTAVEILKNFLRKNQKSVVAFSAYERGRQALYQRFVRDIGSIIQGYVGFTPSRTSNMYIMPKEKLEKFKEYIEKKRYPYN